MNIAALSRAGTISIVLMTAWGERSFGQDDPPPKPAPKDAPAPVQRAAFRSSYFVNGVTFIFQDFREPVEAVPSETEDDFDVGQFRPEVDENAVGSQVWMGDAFDQMLLGPGWSADSAEELCHKALQQKIRICDRIITLTALQKQKLQLAGHGDIARLFKKIQRHEEKFQKLADRLEGIDDFRAWMQQLISESNTLRVHWRTSPFADGSLFAKTLATMCTPEQMVELRRRQCIPHQPGGPPVTVRLIVKE
jgi:hypothetical protein